MISPIALPIVIMFDAAVVYYFIFAIKKVTVDSSAFASVFLALQGGMLIVAALTTREVLRHGVRITDKYVEFTALDSDNKVRFDEIEKIAVQKDTKASFKKNFVSRYSSIVFYLNDDSVLTVELGITTKRKLAQIEKEINDRIIK